MPLAPPTQKLPAGHAIPAADDEPGGQKKPAPAVQGVQDVAPLDEEKVLALQGVQDVAPLDEEKVPALQGEQCIDPAGMWLPAVHNLHSASSPGSGATTNRNRSFVDREPGCVIPPIM